MMSKSTSIALGVFALLFAIAIYTSTAETQKGVSRVSLAEIDTATLTKIEIGGEAAIKLNRVGDVWTIDDNKSADPQVIKTLLDTFKRTHSSDLMSRNSSRYAEYEVGTEKGVFVKAWAGEMLLADFVVGKSASGGSYMLFDGAIYKISKVFPATFKKERKAWFNRKLFDDQIADVKRLAVSAPGVSYALIQKDGEWALEDASVLPEGFRFDSGLARSLVNGVIGTRAKEILEKDPEAATSGLGKDAWALAYSVGAGASAKVHTLLIGKSDAEKNVYAKSVESDDSLLLPASGAARLQKKIEDFRNLHVMDFDAAKAKELSIRTSKGLLSFVKTEGQWAIGKSFEKAAEGFEFDPSTVARRLGVISSLKADARLDLDTAAAGLLAPRSVITVVQEDGTTVRLITGKEVQTGDKTNVYISGNIDGAVYQVAKARIDQLVGGLESFKKVAPPPGGMGGNPLGNIDPQQLQNLPPEIRQQLIQQLMQQQQGRQTQ